MNKEKILIIDDEKDIVKLIKYNLEKEGYKIISALDGEKGLEIIFKEKPHLIILDLMLPGLDGLELCKILKRNEETYNIPIIMLTAKGEESDIVVGLELGADDYITKPFSPRVLLARVKAVLRRTKDMKKEDKVIQINDLIIDLNKHIVTLKGKRLNLTLTEFNLLKFLAQNRGKVFTRNQLLDKVWEGGGFVIDRTVDVHIRRIREKLGEASFLIETIRGVGYRFINEF